MAEKVILMCKECKSRNYVTSRGKKTSALTLNKYCRFCRKHTAHKEK